MNQLSKKMKKLVLITLIFLTQISNAQVTRNLGDFDAVKVFDRIKIKLIAASENKAIVTGNRKDLVQFVNKNGELKIRMPFSQLLAGDDVTVELYFKNLESITVTGGSYVTNKADFKQTSLELIAKSGGEINLQIDVDKVNVKTSTGGAVVISGKATNQDVSITSGGILKAADLLTDQTKIIVAAGGVAEINATTLVDVKVKAGGSVSIYGKPKQINQEVFIGGTIEEK